MLEAQHIIANLCCTQKEIWYLYPVLLWWRWMHLCRASFEVSSEGTLSWSIDKQGTAWAANPLAEHSSVRVWKKKTALDLPWRCLGWVNHGLYILLFVCQLSANAHTDRPWQPLKMQPPLMQCQLTLLWVTNCVVVGVIFRFDVVVQPCFLLTSDIFSGRFCWEGGWMALVALSAGICFRAPVCRLGNMLRNGFIWVGRIHVCVRVTGWPVSSSECKTMSCDFTCPAVVYLTPVSARFCLASGYQFALV